MTVFAIITNFVNGSDDKDNDSENYKIMMVNITLNNNVITILHYAISS